MVHIHWENRAGKLDGRALPARKQGPHQNGGMEPGVGGTAHTPGSGREHRPWPTFSYFWILKCLQSLSCAVSSKPRLYDNLSKKHGVMVAGGHCWGRQGGRKREINMWLEDHLSLTRQPPRESLPLAHSKLPVSLGGHLDHKAGLYLVLTALVFHSRSWRNLKALKAQVECLNNWTDILFSHKAKRAEDNSEQRG